jgi:hypothetical protein
MEDELLVSLSRVLSTNAPEVVHPDTTPTTCSCRQPPFRAAAAGEVSILPFMYFVIFFHSVDCVGNTRCMDGYFVTQKELLCE